MTEAPDVDWDSATASAELFDLHAVFHEGTLEMITDARDRRRVALRIDAPGPRRLAAMADDVRFLLVIDGVRSVRATEWAGGDVPRPKAIDDESRRAWIEARQRAGRMESVAWRGVADGGREMTIEHALVLEGPGGAAVRVGGRVGADRKSVWREIVISGEALFYARSDRAPFDRDALLRLGAAHRDA